MLLLGLVLISACLYWTPVMLKEAKVNAMEMVEATSLISWSITVFILLSYTWRSKDQVRTNTIEVTISEDIRWQLHERLS